MAFALAVVFGSAVPASAGAARDQQWFWVPLKVAQAHKIYGAGQLDLLAALTAAQPSPKASAPAPTAPAAVSDAAPADEDSGVPPLVFVAAGLLLLLGAVAVGAVLLTRSRRAGG